MKRHQIAAIACLAAAIAGSTALAQEIDADGDGSYSMEELLVVFPTLTSDAFMSADTDGDGALDPDELAAAQADGLIPMQEG
jgi:hypothetical protein